MSRTLPPSASVASHTDSAKMHAPAAERNTDALTKLLEVHAPSRGKALELASGTGQHIVTFARAFPKITWQPSEFDPIRIASINAYTAEAALDNLRKAVHVDATQPGWKARFGVKDLILLINLLHLISDRQAKIVIGEAMSALGPAGRLILYGPFKRDGILTSDGDARFHAQLAAADSAIGYKNDAEMEAWLAQAGAAEVTRVEMPANNLAFVATR